MANILPYPDQLDPGQMGWRELIFACAQERANSRYWTEFLRRYGHRIRHFVRGSWYASIAGGSAAVTGGTEPSDLFQSTIVRLVERDCAAMKRFSGTTEEEWLAYLAVIARSVVRDSLRRCRARKRGRGEDSAFGDSLQRQLPEQEETERPALERGLLAREVRSLLERSMNNPANESSGRDMLIFQLYFDHDLSIGQIAECQGINLSKAGVEKIINRLKDRIRSLVSADTSEAMMR